MDFGFGDMGSFGGLGGMFGGGAGGGGTADIFGRISQLAPQWDPFPILKSLDQVQMASTMNAAPTADAGFAGFMDPRSGVDPSKFATGPLAGIPLTGSQGLPTPPAAQPTAAPLTAQQLAALKAMQPQIQPPHFAPAVPPANHTRAVQMSPLIGGHPGVVRPSLAQILGR